MADKKITALTAETDIDSDDDSMIMLHFEPASTLTHIMGVKIYITEI